MDESANKKKPGPSTPYKLVGKLAVELVTVIAGILIALFVNSIQEKRADKKNLDETLHALSLEFDKNRDNIKSKSHRIQRFRDTLEFYEKDASLSIYDLTVKSPGLTLVELYTTNWQVTLSTNSLRLINFETITLLSEIEAKHNELKEQGQILTSLLYNTAIYKNDREGFYHRKVLASWIGGYMGNEQELIALYDEFKARIAEEK
ncbi:MAG TPA: hypothetical protein VFG46_09310 [Chryseolinea sp.]|nr:hypothetical protein [Chryseolinea sp.]